MLLLVLAVAGAGIFGVVTLWLASPFSLATQSRSTQAVEAMERKGDVVVLGLTVAGVDDKKTVGQLYDIDIPWTTRSVFLRYTFDAKLGFSGEDVKIETAGDTGIKVTIPQFVFIGSDNFKSEIASEDNGVLSWLTPEIDDRAMSEEILTDATKQAYVDKNVDELQQNAEAFYTDLVAAIDPSITLTFEFAQ